MTTTIDLVDALPGQWEGTSTLWFEPGPPVEEAAISGRIRRVGSTRFILHEYTSTTNGEAREGVELLGVDVAGEGGPYCSAWVDSFHTSDDILVSRGDAGSRVSVIGSYADPTGGPRWGWRTQYELEGTDRLVITAYNVLPTGEEIKALETVYTRRVG